MIYPLEYLLRNTENREAYERLCRVFCDIVPYVGTGISFYCQSWGAPFKSIIEVLKRSSAVKNNYFFRPLTEEEKQRAHRALSYTTNNEDKTIYSTLVEYMQSAIDYIDKNTEAEEERIQIRLPKTGGKEETKQIWAALQGLYNSYKFLELGELLNIFCETLKAKTFNLYFFEAINRFTQNSGEKVKNDHEMLRGLQDKYNNEALPPSRWFLPYLGEDKKFAITTNTDNSLTTVYSEHKYHEQNTAPMSFSGKSERAIWDTIPKETMKIYHIHGFQLNPNRNTSQTFVMTWSDYRKAYHHKEGSSSEVLENTFINDTLLFVGASLEKDITVDLMKKAASSHAFTGKHVAFLCKPKEEKINRLANAMATLCIATPDFPSYSSIFCQLIRENKTKEWGVINQVLRNNIHGKAEYGRKILQFLDSNDQFDIFSEEMIEGELEASVYPAIKKRLAHNGLRTYQWSVCRVDDDSFSFPIKPFTTTENGQNTYYLDSYAAPLGSTIYIIGGHNCTREGVNKLISEISKWTMVHATNYWKSRKQVKIRIIRVSNIGDLSPAKIIDKIDHISNLQPDEESKELWGLLQEMQQYKTYRDLGIITFTEGEVAYDSRRVISILLLTISVKELFKDFKEDIDRMIKQYTIPYIFRNQYTPPTQEIDNAQNTKKLLRSPRE